MEAVSVEVSRIVYEIGLEVDRAKQEFGDEFDRKNTLNDWITYTNIYLGRAAQMGTSIADQEMNFRKAAGLLVNALVMLRTTGFAPRHYEGQTHPVSLPEVK